MVIDASAQYIHIMLHGEYDIARQEELRSELEPAYCAAMALLDMSAVSYIDASALTELIRLRKHMPEPAIIRMVGVMANIRRLLNVTGLVKMFEIYDTVKNALTEWQMEQGSPRR
ncbi:anti-sigma factor antagonist [bacterium]|nr:MAG: anti-sigma factor antagonist [bacterium]